MAAEPRVFVGLGNPGKQYENTRHNIGFFVVQQYAKQLGLTWKEEAKFQARIAKGVDKEKEIHLLMPHTYMNLSGVSVRSYIEYYHFSLSSLVIIVDDVAIPFGEMKLKPCGSTGGHNGLKSIETCLGSQEYTRLRMGVGAPREVDSLADYVLSPFEGKEKEDLPNFAEQGVIVIRRLLEENIENIMQDVNIRKLPEKGSGESNEK